MKWKATHILTMGGDVPRKVMLNSGCLFFKSEWENAHASEFSYFDGRLYQAPYGLMRQHHPDREPDRMLISDGYSLKPIGEQSGQSGTPMRKAVTRITTEFKVKVNGKMRLVAVTMGPGDTITMRPKGCKSSSARVIDLGSVWGLSTKQVARKLVRERRAKRKAAA